MYRTQEEIKEKMLSHITNNVDKSQSGLTHDVIAAASIEFLQAYMNLRLTRDKLDVENLEGTELERFIYPRTGLARRHATKAITTVVITGQVGSQISKGDLVSTGVVDFKSLEERTIGENGEMTVVVAAVDSGTIGNVPAASINNFPVSIPGLVSVYNPEAVTNGHNAESDTDYRQRYYDKLQRPGKAGNVYHYEEWAKEVAGIGDVRVLPRWDGPLTVKVVIIDAEKQPADTELIDRTYSHIEAERPFGANVTVISAAPKEINMNFELDIDPNYELEEVRENISNNMINYLKEIAFKEDYVSYARIGSEILDAEGVVDYSNLTINNTTSNIAIGYEEVAIMGVIQ